MRLNEKIDPKETTRRDAAKDLIELVREAWELDSPFCTNYVLTLNERKDGSSVIRLHTPNVSHGGEEMSLSSLSPTRTRRRKPNSKTAVFFEKYEALLSEDEESDEAAQMYVGTPRTATTTTATRAGWRTKSKRRWLRSSLKARRHGRAGGANPARLQQTMRRTRNKMRDIEYERSS